MGVRENKVEKYLDSEVKKLGGITRKWVSPGCDGVPDRIVIINGDVWFVEVKTLDGEVTAVQAREHHRLWKCGANVRVVHGEWGVDLFIKIFEANVLIKNLLQRKLQKYACGKLIPSDKGNTNANSGCDDFNCGPCNKFLYGD